MRIPLVCPNCRKRFTVGPELGGRRVKCSACQTPFEVPRLANKPAPLDELELVEPSDDVEVQPAAPPPRLAPAQRRSAPAPLQPTPAPRPAPAPAVRPAARPAPQEWTAGQRLVFRTGWQVMAFGVVSLVLPLFGIQFRKLQSAGANAGAVGVGLIVLGALMCGGVLLRRALGGGRVSGRALLIGVAAIPAACIAFVVIGAFLNRPGRRAAPAPPQFSRSGDFSPRRGPEAHAPAGRPSFGGTAPGGRPGPIGPGGPPPRPDGETLADRYGADRVARLVITGGPPPEGPPRRGRSRLESLVADKIRPALGRGDHQINTSRGPDGRVDVEAAPVADLDALVKLLDVGTVTRVDAATRTITLEVDPAALPPAP